MKKLIPLIAITLFAATAFAQQQPENTYPYGPVAYRTLRQTIGEKYLVLPVTYYKYLYLKSDDDPEKPLTPKDMAGKTLTLVSMDDVGEHGYFVDSANLKYTVDIRQSIFPHMIPAADIDSARKLFLNKTLWLNSNRLITGNPYQDSTYKRIEVERFSPVTVIDMGVGTQSAPVVFILKTKQDSVGFLFVNVSGTNTNTYVNSTFLFAKNFFSQDPKILYHFTPQTWENIKAEKVVVGMPQDAVLLIWGPPDASHRTVTGNHQYPVGIWHRPGHKVLLLYQRQNIIFRKLT